MKVNHFILIGAFLSISGSIFPLFPFFGISINLTSIVGGVIVAASTFLYMRVVLSNEKEYEEESVMLLKSIKDLIDQNARLSMQMAQSNININGQLTGGDSFCLITPFISASGELGITARQQGEFPIYNVFLTIIDLEELTDTNSKDSSTIDNFRLESKVFEIGDLPVHGTRIFTNTGISLYGEQRSFDISFTARNGDMTEYLRMHHIGNDWKTAIRIKNERTGKIVCETINEEINKETLRW